jgi:hypothetical protein
MPPSTNRKIRALKVSEEDLTAGDISKLTRLFDEVVASPRYAKTLRGGIIFSFGGYEHDGRHGFEIEPVRRYTQRIDERYPQFAYFLPEDPKYSQIFSWIASLATPMEPQEGEEGIAVDPRELTRIVITRIEAVRQFCLKIGDDPARTVNAILEAMPDEITEAVKTELGR